MKIERRPIKRGKPYPPIVVDSEGVILSGHGRLLASQKPGQVPAHVADNLTPEQIRGYRLMDNRPHEDTAWNPTSLKAEIVALDSKSDSEEAV